MKKNKHTHTHTHTPTHWEWRVGIWSRRVTRWESVNLIIVYDLSGPFAQVLPPHGPMSFRCTVRAGFRVSHVVHLSISAAESWRQEKKKKKKKEKKKIRYSETIRKHWRRGALIRRFGVDREVGWCHPGFIWVFIALKSIVVFISDFSFCCWCFQGLWWQKRPLKRDWIHWKVLLKCCFSRIFKAENFYNAVTFQSYFTKNFWV